MRKTIKMRFNRASLQGEQPDRTRVRLIVDDAAEGERYWREDDDKLGEGKMVD